MNTQKLTNQEAEHIMEFLVKTTVKTLGISAKQAKLRVEALFKSGVLNKFGNPDELNFQIAVDVAMQIPQPE